MGTPVANNAATSAPVQNGLNASGQTIERTFKKLEEKDFGKTDHNNHRFWIKVEFHNGHVAEFDSVAHSKENTYKMIDYIGRKTINYSQDEFNKFMKERDGKPFWFNIEEDKDGSAVTTGYKTDGSGQYLVFAFSNPVLRCSKSLCEEFKSIAEPYQVGPRVSDLANRVQVQLQAVN